LVGDQLNICAEPATAQLSSIVIMKKVSNHILGRVYILLGAFLLFGVLILLRVGALQLNQSKWIRKGIEEQVFFKKVVADRGNILAEDGSIMATSLPFYRVGMDPSVLDTTSWLGFRDSLYQLSLNFTTHFDSEENRDTLKVYNRVMEAIRTGDRHIYLSRKKLNFKELEMVREWPILRWGRMEGGMVVEKFHNERYYPMGDLARITLGKIIDDTVALRGIEYSFNRDLRGRDGYLLAQKVVGGSYVPLDHFGKEASTDGYDVTTTLDVDMQDVVQRALKKGVEQNFAKYGVAVLMEVGTGKIKAIANYPETYNHAVATQIEPGSTFKLASAAALMEDDLIDLCDTINTGSGVIMYDDKEVTDNGKAYGEISFEEAFAYSSNVGISMTINNLYADQPEAYHDHLRAFGFGDIVNTQLVGEPKPRLIQPEDEDWNIATLPSQSYGYSLLVTPLQMATFYNGIANKGKLMRPWIVKEIRQDSRIQQQFGPEVLNEEMVSEYTAIRARELLKAVVEYGTANRAFRNMPFKVAGKTGTARKTKLGQGYVREYRASFGGFFPADEPRYSLYIMIDEPEGNYASGGRVAAPVFRNIAEEIYRMDQGLVRPPALDEDGKPSAKPAPKVIFAHNAEVVYPTLGITTSQLPATEWVAADANGHQVNLKPFELEEKVVPNLRGMSGRDAMYLMEKMGVKVYVKGMGRVRRQSLLPGYKLSEDNSITLFLG
jgi:cell division protein FtsI (penicillin-binding protein 3)